METETFSFNNLSTFEDRAYGAVLGAFWGDSIGSHVEFRSKVDENLAKQALKMIGKGPFDLAPGQVTDDSELALCLGMALAEGEGIMSLDRIGFYYGEWINSDPFDIGNTIRGGLDGLWTKERSKLHGEMS